MLRWMRKKPSADKVAVELLCDTLKHAQTKRKTAMRSLMDALEDIPVEDGISDVGRDLLGGKDGHDD